MNDALIDFLRGQISKCAEVLAKPKITGEKTLEREFSRGFWSGRRDAYSTALYELASKGVEMKPDLNLIAEAENLIPKGGFHCSHELNRMLHHYRAGFKAKNWPQCALNEQTIRRGIVRARLEAAGLKQPE